MANNRETYYRGLGWRPSMPNPRDIPTNTCRFSFFGVPAADQIDNQRHQILVGHSTVWGAAGSADRMRESHGFRRRLCLCLAARLLSDPLRWWTRLNTL